MASLINLKTSSANEMVGALTTAIEGSGLLAFTFNQADQELMNLLLRSASNYPNAMKSEVPALSSPAAYSLMHELSRRFTKAICLLTETDRTQLEPYLDSLPSVLGGQGGASKLIISRNVAAPAHIDRGLFNLVIGKGKDLVSLHVQLRDDGPMESVKCLLPANAATSSSLYGILLPGLTLQLIDKRFKARNHKVVAGSSRSKRDALIFQWRLNPGFKVDLDNVLNHLPSFLVLPPPAVAPAATTTPPARRSVHDGQDMFICLGVRFSDGEIFRYSIRRSAMVSSLVKAIRSQLNSETRYDYYFVVDGERLQEDITLEQYQFEDGDTIDAMKIQVGD